MTPVPATSEDLAPTIFIVFGVTGDLARRKLFPALFDLARFGGMPKQYRIVGFSRKPLSPEEFAMLVTDSLSNSKKNADDAALKDFLAHASYTQGNFDELASYQKLAERLQEIDEKDFGRCSNKLFHLAIPPTLYEGVFRQLSESGLTIPCGGDTGWTRVLVEKPFGRDVHTARRLDALLGELFREEQIFRIDHYLAKETLQNVLAFRFGNGLFEPLWNAEHVESVEMKLFEKLDLEGRGAFFDDVGMIRDVGQNHLLQMLALVGMDKPESFTASAIRRERARVFERLERITEEELPKRVVRGQYEGYRLDKGVRADSDTETYFRIEARIDSLSWRGVPFYLESGKALDESRAEIVVRFNAKEGQGQNALIFRIQPDEGISILFWTKTPGLAYKTEAKTLSYLYRDAHAEDRIPDPYEKVLYDCIRGDQTLFASTEEVAASWRFITPIIEGLPAVPLVTYKKGSRPENIQ